MLQTNTTDKLCYSNFESKIDSCQQTLELSANIWHFIVQEKGMLE